MQREGDKRPVVGMGSGQVGRERECPEDTAVAVEERIGLGQVVAGIAVGGHPEVERAEPLVGLR